MKIWVLSKYSGVDCFDNNTSYKYFISYELAKTHLDADRKTFKESLYKDGEPIFKFTDDEINKFKCEDGTWSYEYEISEADVIEF